MKTLTRVILVNVSLTAGLVMSYYRGYRLVPIAVNSERK